MTASLLLQPPPGGRLIIDTGAIVANWRTLAALSGPAETAAAVKGDAYGLGLAPVARALHAAGCRTFFVALPSEGVELRAALPEAVIYVLNGFFDGAGPTYLTNRLRPVLGDPGEIAAWAKEAGDRGEPVAIHVDSGMNRLGLEAGAFVALLAESGAIARLRPALLMSHLASADDPASPLTALQTLRFHAFAQLVPAVPTSLANTAGIIAHPETRGDLTRPGIGLYGHGPVPGGTVMRPVVKAEARVIQVRQVAAGEVVGYGGTFTTTRSSRIAIVSAGYADGFSRLAGRPPAFAAVGDELVPLAGRVSMDMLAIDVTDLGDRAPVRGDFVELFGDRIPLEEVANRAETIPYEILTSLGRRFERQYLLP